ncbi:lytic transglycosylase domain-containing protein [Cellulosilyticum sp. I15G10I2]|uniref:lytic transglycosylase domain-containing protein n=1 Tax=Cellulosilyticum sp. I15G10I2 TaxID=1892843 RepID=UPI001FA7CE65|nr:lytic transglycosylase domain-containing protein [Cellulosilyticum sp. I15G10I2]
MKKVFFGSLIIKSVICIGLAVLCIYSLYPQAYKEVVYKYAKEYEVDPLLIYAIMKTESKHNPNAISRSGAKGLMQIMDKTGAWGAEEVAISNYSHETLFKPDINIQIGCWYISKLIRQYNEDVDLALAAYNAGSGNIAKWRNNPRYSQDGKSLSDMPFRETKLYVKRVKQHYKVYQFLYRY